MIYFDIKKWGSSNDSDTEQPPQEQPPPPPPPPQELSVTDSQSERESQLSENSESYDDDVTEPEEDFAYAFDSEIDQDEQESEDTSDQVSDIEMSESGISDGPEYRDPTLRSESDEEMVDEEPNRGIPLPPRTPPPSPPQFSTNDLGSGDGNNNNNRNNNVLDYAMHVAAAEHMLMDQGPPAFNLRSRARANEQDRDSEPDGPCTCGCTPQPVHGPAPFDPRLVSGDGPAAAVAAPPSPPPTPPTPPQLNATNGAISAAQPRPRATTRKRKRTPSPLRGELRYERYLHQTLESHHPDLSISRSAMCIMNGMMNNVFEKIVTEAAHLGKTNVAGAKRKTLTQREITAGTKLILNGKLIRYAVSEACSAVKTFKESQRKPKPPPAI